MSQSNENQSGNSNDLNLNANDNANANNNRVNDVLGTLEEGSKFVSILALYAAAGRAAGDATHPNRDSSMAMGALALSAAAGAVSVAAGTARRYLEPGEETSTESNDKDKKSPQGQSK